VIWFQHLESVIRVRLPKVASLINRNIDELEAELTRLGRPVAVDAGVRSYLLFSVYYNIKVEVILLILSL